ncbi:hypothetical protein DSO57_1036137 [Entomophthora muscae]|uniref:Uncharacterized protein n=1 Tax=Entomophthora muscae TaxID=34485 RepID=A0ACC2TY02_9FUNG|nr:hypothetical protein DSO57_1036137 [Entomophthora muscae]
MQGLTVAGSGWVSWNTSITLPADCFWPVIDDYTHWHLEKATVFKNLTIVQRPVEDVGIGLASKWGYMWSKPTNISHHLSCYTGEKCEINGIWDSTGYRVNYTKQSNNKKSLLQLRHIGVRIERMQNSVSFVFGFYGPSEYHLEFQQEYWASPLARKWYSFEPQQYLKYPLYDNGIPVGLIHHKKGPKFEEEY